jgi:pimeloyl-ACP methyl ester carboxylesterase
MRILLVRVGWYASEAKRAPGASSAVRTVSRLPGSSHDRRKDSIWSEQLPRLDLSDEASRVRCPTLILGGELDPLATSADLEDLAAAIPGSQLTIVPGTGHGLRNKPDEGAAPQLGTNPNVTCAVGLSPEGSAAYTSLVPDHSL